MVGIHTITVLKHLQALSLHSICLSMCVCGRVCLHSTYMFQPETSRETEGAVPRIRNLVFPNPRHRVPPALAQQATLASWWAMLGNPGTILVKAMPEGRGILERSFSDPHPKKIASKSPGRKRKKNKTVFTKDCISEAGVYSRACLLSRRFNFRAHTRGKSSIRPQRWIYIYTGARRTAAQLSHRCQQEHFSFPSPPPTCFLMFLPRLGKA